MISSRRLVFLVLAAVMAVVVAGCSSSDNGDEGSGERSADEIVAASALAMAEVETAAFTIEQSGSGIFIDDANTLAFQGADGRFARPASADALITVDAFGFTTEVGAIAIGGEIWFTNPLSGTWTEAPEGLAFNPASVFEAESGLPALLSEAAGGAVLVDDAGSDGGGDPGPEGTVHLQTTVSADRVSVLTGGLATEETEVDLWIDPETDLVAEARFDLSADDGVSNWRMTISDYGAEVVIEAPEVGSAS
ncbi:MAG: LppX_LprAFG lipoprotein [Actinomycetia bacterium]|nr:LppX_LprAFG lipoprotein [Actinomycetes bacterium]